MRLKMTLCRGYHDAGLEAMPRGIANGERMMFGSMHVIVHIVAANLRCRVHCHVGLQLW